AIEPPRRNASGRRPCTRAPSWTRPPVGGEEDAWRAMTEPERPTVRVTHRFRASAERVFDAWLDPVRAGTFLFASPDGKMLRAEIDPRVGGRFEFVDRRDGIDV